METLGGLGGGGTYSNNLDKLDGLSNSGGGGAGTLYKTRSGNGGSGIVIIKLKESSQSFNFNVTYNNNEILNQNYITTSEFKDVFNITSHLDYLTINETFVEHFAYGANYSVFENGNLNPAVNPGIYDNENSQYWGRQTIYETNVKGRFLWNKPEGVEEVIAYVWGAGGGAGPGYTGGFHSERYNIRGGNGGFVKAKINVKDIDKLNIIIGQCGGIGVSNKGWPGGGKSGGSCGCGGGLSGIFLEDEFKIDNYGWSHGHDYYLTFQKLNPDIPESSILIIAGGGGGAGGYNSSDNYQSTLDGNWFKAIGGDAGFETENYIYGKSGFNTKLRLSNSGGPGTLISGGSGGGRSGGGWANGQSGSKFKGGDTGRHGHQGYLADNSGTGGSGYYGGGSAGYNGIACAGGGGSSYYAHNLVSPIIAFGNDTDSLNTTNYVPYNIPKSTSLGGTYFSNENNLDRNGGNGYIILEYSYKNPVDRNLYIKYYPTKYITVQTIDEFIPEINSINLRNEESNYKIIDTFNSSIFKNNEYLYFNGSITETTNSNFINLSITDESIIYANNNIYNCEILYINYSSNLYNYQSDIILQNNIYKVSSNLDNIINQNNETIYNLTSTNNIDNEFDNLIEEFNIEYDTSGIKLLIKYNNPVSSNIEIEKLNRTLYFKEGIEDVEYLVTDGIKYSYGIDNFDSVYYLSLDKFNSELKSNSYKPIIFKYDENNDNGNNQSEWKLNLEKDALYDILIVAGGGAGGAGYYPQPWKSWANGGGGGAGGVVYMVNKYLLSSVEYKIIVGDGGKGENHQL